MEDVFKVYLNSLQDGGEEVIQRSASPVFLEVGEEELKFTEPVEVVGKAYLADNSLIIRCKINTTVQIPCAICNSFVRVPLEVSDWIHNEPTKQIKAGVFDFAPLLREALLLEVPRVAECHEGNCPERAHLAKYFSKEKK